MEQTQQQTDNRPLTATPLTVLVTRLGEIDKSLHRLDEAACNGDLTKHQETQERNLTEEARGIVGELVSRAGVRANFHRNHDPRGASVKVEGDREALQEFRELDRRFSFDWGGYLYVNA